MGKYKRLKDMGKWKKLKDMGKKIGFRKWYCSNATFEI